MSWGIKIACLYTGFAVFIAAMVSLTMRERIELVTTDYYEQELKYQERVNQLERTAKLGEQLHWELKGSTLQLHFPEVFANRKIHGKIYFLRPSDARMDATVVLSENTGKTTVQLGKLPRGMYKMQVSWLVDTTTYFNEGFIQIH